MFGPATKSPFNHGPTEVLISDFDGNGHLDIAAHGSNSNNVCILYNNGGASFDPIVCYPIDERPHRIAAADLDGDGDVDFATVHTFPDGHLQVILNSPDTDGDGFGLDCDCDDTDPALNPNTVWFEDLDDDGFGNSDIDSVICEQPAGFVLDSSDCDDTDAVINPATRWFADSDGDGFGDLAVTITQCDTVPGFVLDSTDCDDTDPAVNPSAQEICNGIDDDCDGTVDSNAIDATAWYLDADGDDYGNSDSSLVQCDSLPGYVRDSTDCDDADPTVYPGALELCNGVDDNCDGVPDICDCHADPECDGQTDVLDVVHAVDVGFRNEPDISDPNLDCPRNTTDVDCDGDTDVFDVVRFVNVAFRNEPPEDNFCNPCAL